MALTLYPITRINKKFYPVSNHNLDATTIPPNKFQNGSGCRPCFILSTWLVHGSLGWGDIADHPLDLLLVLLPEGSCDKTMVWPSPVQSGVLSGL